MLTRENARLFYKHSTDPAAVPFGQHSHRGDFRSLPRLSLDRQEADVRALFRRDERRTRSCGFREFKQCSFELKPIRQRSQDRFCYGSVGVSVCTQFDGQPLDRTSSSSPTRGPRPRKGSFSGRRRSAARADVGRNACGRAAGNYGCRSASASRTWRQNGAGAFAPAILTCWSSRPPQTRAR